MSKDSSPPAKEDCGKPQSDAAIARRRHDGEPARIASREGLMKPSFRLLREQQERAARAHDFKKPKPRGSA
jgi:hypothetical protein